MNWTKAHVISLLAKQVTLSHVAPLITIDRQTWLANPHAEIQRIQTTFNSLVIVRSSCAEEDSIDASHAGEFDSLLNINTSDEQQLREAINQVFASYKSDDEKQQLFIQPMVEDVIITGVITTRTSPTAAPYYTINYQFTDKTQAITEGKQALDTLVIYRRQPECITRLEPEFVRLLPAINEIEKILSHDCLDIEFVIDGQQRIWILQARPITSINQHQRVCDEDVHHLITDMQVFFKESQQSNSQVHGDLALYGGMPDINPAELIGARPHPLSFSLYREIVTNQVCGLARRIFGYRDMTLQPLLQSFAGQPYVDIRASFNTYIPKDISESLSRKLANYYLNRLKNHPEFHDKVEFDILITCINFNFDQREKELSQAGFTPTEINEFKQALTKITNHTFQQLSQSLALLDKLQPDFDRIMTHQLQPIDLAVQLIESTKQFGTLAFVEVARCGFAAVSFLQAMVSDGVISAKQADDFMINLHTVASEFQHDGALVHEGKLSWDHFVRRYGHLRPGTYEITYPCYRDNPELYLKPTVKPLEHIHCDTHLFQTDKIKQYCQQQFEKWQLDITVKEFESFIKKSIEAREYAKFLFSRNLSEALEAMALFGKQYDISREDIAYVAYEDLKQCALGTTITDIKHFLTERIEQGKHAKQLVNAIELPHLILHTEDITGFRYPVSSPNFVTQQVVIAEVCKITQHIKDKSSIQNKIILVPQADPGFDWIFAYDIAGLVTLFGGVNSHMAIRCAEMDIPAAIGIGKKLFAQLIHAKSINLDCLGKRIEKIN
ncbi:MAG: PEP/pyruvate-binding domain-containing protein [Coxiellaceae bacterium]|nr:PEP/pyruvate-binding domain-containing protein [Coxiellaceae bacterium]